MGRAAAKIALFFAFPALVYACGLDDSVVLKSADGDGGSGGGGGDATVGGDAGGGSGDSGSGGGGDSGSGSSDGGTTLTPTPVFGISSTALYELDTSNVTLKNLGNLTSCNDLAIDIAITPTNQLYAITQNGGNRDVAVLSMAGTCSQQQQLDSSHSLSMGYAASNLLELRDNDDSLQVLDPTTGSDNSLNNSALPASAFTDIACDSTKCWFEVAHNHCNPDLGAATPCLYNMDPDGNNAAQFRELANMGVGGLAYQGKFLYLFAAGAPTIYKIDLTDAGATIQTLSPTGDTAPASWQGAASSSNYL